MTNSLKYLTETNFSKKTLRALDVFWIGFIGYTTSWAIGSAFSTNNPAFQLIQLISLLLFIPAAINLIRFNIDDKYLKIMYTLYCMWLLTVILRGLVFDLTFLKDKLFNADYGVFPYLAPLILLFPRDFVFYKKIFNVIVILGIFYVIYDIIFVKELLTSDHENFRSVQTIEGFSKYLSLSSGFLLFTYIYHKRNRRLFAIGIIILTLLLAIIRARRGLIAMCLATIVFSYILYLLTSKGKLIIIFLSIFVIFFATIYINEIITQNKNSIFSYLIARGDEDTRTGVEEYFYADMSINDWIIGRGINGQYFCPDIEGDKIYRYVIETDYLCIILKGGLVSLGLLLFIVTPAIFKGLFYSKNILSKAAAVWILIWVLSLYPANVTTFTLNYLLVWVSVGICYSKKLRNLSDETIKASLQS